MVAGNNGVLTKATDAKKANEQGTYADRVRLAAQAALIDGEGTINITDTTGTAKGSLKKALLEEFGTDFSGYQTGNGKVTLNGKIYSISTNGSVTEPQWKIDIDNGNVGLTIGDLLVPTVPGLENEKFYVIADNGTTLTLLAERCVSTTTNTQVPDDTYSTPAFDDSSNVYNGSDIQVLVNNYVGTLTGLDLEDVEVAYNTTKVTDVKGRLMWKEEAEDTTFTSVTNYSDILYGPSTARINYWLGSPLADYDDGAWKVDGCDVCGDGVFLDGHCGLRPVIKILKSNV